ncbi:MAG: hypothetical protein ACR2PM_13785 [Hyphomicrobiales bacterium]
MSDSPANKPQTEYDGRLRAALDLARDQQAERFDAIDTVRALETARLQLLADDLEPVFADIPERNDLYVCRLVPGDPPRLWIDMLSYVAIGDDSHTYQFVETGRSGRKILAESAEISEISAHVTSYLAHRLIDRERASAASPTSVRRGDGEGFTGSALLFAWICGFVVGALALLIMGLIIYGAP